MAKVKDNKTCLVCGKKYSYCPSCAEFKTLPKWKNLFDTENCKNIYDVVAGYNTKTKTREVAREAILKCDLSNLGSLKEQVKTVIDDLLFVEPIVIEGPVVAPAVEAKVETEAEKVEEVTSEAEVVTPVEKEVSPIRIRKRNRNFSVDSEN